MEPKFDTKFDSTLSKMRATAGAIENDGIRNRLLNYIDKLTGTVRRASTHPSFEVSLDEQTPEQIADRYIARKAIFEAMLHGRKITLKDSKEFRCSEMHTQIHCIRRDIEDRNLPYVLKDRWISIAPYNKRCKVYWLEDKDESSTN